jgi:phage-related minor tail protein
VETLARLKAEHIDLIDPVEKYRKKLDEVEKLKEAGLLTPDQATEAAFYWNEQIDGALKFGEVAKDTDSSLKDLQRAIEGWGKASADAFVEFAFTGKTSFGGLVDSILKDLARMAAYNAFKPLFNSFSDSIGKSNFFSDLFGGSGGGGGTLFGIKTSAKGNVFDSAGLSAYSGKVVSRPTLFPFASGIGLMGEAGPEAILPLSRGRDGKLGVAGGGNVVNNYNTSIVVESSGEVRSEGNARELGRRFESAVRNVLLTEKRPGGLLT